jgi:D-serine deaminase-like pyridoxal phosphate-dependent protein
LRTFNLCERLYTRDKGLAIRSKKHLSAAGIAVFPKETRMCSEVGNHKSEIDTPALLIDLDAMERNLARMADFMDGKTAHIRPHVKLHRATPILAHKQIAAGGVGLTCAKLAEAELLGAAGFTDILIANQIVGAQKIRRLVNLAAYTDVIVAVDHPDNVRALSEAAAARGVTLRVLVEVDIGHHRCGVPPFTPVLELARLVHESPGLRFMGLMGYDGHLTLKVTPEERALKALESARLLVETRHNVEASGLPVPIVSASGTFTYRYASQVEGITEIQAGTYLLMDTTFRDKGVTEFELALSVIGTVTSRPSPTLAILDIGRKAMDTGWGMPQVKSHPGATMTSMSQEHGRMDVSGVENPPHIGDQVELWAADCNCTINLYDRFYAMRGEIVEAVWEIPGRGAST